MSKKQSRTKLFITFGIVFWFLAVIFVVIPIWPNIYYRLAPKASDSLASTISLAVVPNEGGSSPNLKSSILNPKYVIPDLDPSLPTENGLIIDSIGVRGELHEGDDWQSILKKGIWRVPNFGTPTEGGLPVILAAHRWGYLSWSPAFRHLNSFYNLPKLKIGDKIDLIWNQRKYIYEVYATDSGDKITDYSANLILYTCQLWNSPTRLFAYAKRTS